MGAFNIAPAGERLTIAVLGRRNAGKSSLINALTGQNIAIVSDVAGTTNDPVSKAMEILPLGPVTIIDTAGIDDEGDLGHLRVEKTVGVLERADIAILVLDATQEPGAWEDDLAGRLGKNGVPTVVVSNKTDLQPDSPAIRCWAEARGFPWLAFSARLQTGVAELKARLIELRPTESALRDTIIGDLIAPGDVILLVVPIDQAAPKGRLILPQVLTLRDILDHKAMGLVVKESELSQALAKLGTAPSLVITDSQAFRQVAAETPWNIRLTSFSILMARYRGDLDRFVEGARALRSLKAGGRVLIAEGCTHHRQADDIGTVKLPNWLRQRAGGDLHFQTCSGLDFPPNLRDFDIVIHCGSCTLNRREVLRRQSYAAQRGVPMTNYGLTLAWVHGILERALEPFPPSREIWER